MPNFTGRIINGGQYQLVKELGAGAYGVVYKAIGLMPSASGKEFAIKVLRKASMTRRNRRHARREIILHRAMGVHPNVITMHDAFEDDDYVFIVLDYCPGGDLFGKICEEKVFYRDDELVKLVFLQLIDAVHAGHRRRIFHRDLKPENILISEDCNEVFVADYGLATTAQVSETFGCGSSYYMSPGKFIVLAVEILILTSSFQNVLGRSVASSPTPTAPTTSGPWASSSSIWSLAAVLGLRQ